jgi:hypothetical protein
LYWLSFLILTLALYLPPANLARHAWEWAGRQYWVLPGLEWPCPAWCAYTFWLTVAYLTLGTALHLLQRRLPADNRIARLALRITRADLGGLDVLTVVAAVVILLLAWPILPAGWILWGWHYRISAPVAALAALSILAQVLRLAEDNVWADRAFAAFRTTWLIEHGYYK